jgi:hypothetical protein
MQEARPMTYEDLRERVLSEPILASDGNHSARLWRIAENVRDHALRDSADDRLLHLVARLGVFCRGLAADIRARQTSPEEAAILLAQLADLGEISFEQWRRR